MDYIIMIFVENLRLLILPWNVCIFKIYKVKVDIIIAD